MAQIAEDLFLLLLDNASAQPALERQRRERVLSAAVLLDLAYACRIRPAVAGESVEPGRLIALAMPGAMDPVVEPAFQLLQRQPLRPLTAVKRLSKSTEENLTHHLERTGQIRRIRLQSKRFTHPYALPLTNRDRVSHARSALLAALFERKPPGSIDGGDHLASARRRRPRRAAEPQRSRLALGARPGRRNRQRELG